MKPKLRWSPSTSVATSIFVIVLVNLIIAGYWVPWTGFDAYRINPQYVREKTLWDWLQLLIVPTVLALGAVYFNRAERRNELQIAEQRAQTERDIAEQRVQYDTLQTYLDQMTDLLLEKQLRTSPPDSEVRHVARVRTFAALRRLDRDRRRILMQFLQDAKLVGLDEEDLIIDFRRADFGGADLSWTFMTGINLSEINFVGAKLSGTVFSQSNLSLARMSNANLAESFFFNTDLRAAFLDGTNLSKVNLWQSDLTAALLLGADVRNAKLTGTKLHRADLSGANLAGAEVDAEQLAQAKSLRGAIMPDGSKHN